MENTWLYYFRNTKRVGEECTKETVLPPVMREEGAEQSGAVTYDVSADRMIVRVCRFPESSVRRGEIYKRYTEPDRFYEKTVSVEGKVFTVQALWRVQRPRYLPDTKTFEIKIFDTDKTLIALMERNGKILTGEEAIVEKAIGVLCPFTADVILSDPSVQSAVLVCLDKPVQNKK